MVLFVSEICRLILGFFEQENLTKTYETFLEECKYLEECNLYHKKTIPFSKHIDGKTLKDYLLINETISYATISTQTDSFVENDLVNDKSVSEIDPSTKSIITPVTKSSNTTTVVSNANFLLRSLVFSDENNETRSKKATTSKSVSMNSPKNDLQTTKKSNRKSSKLPNRHKSSLLLTTPKKNQNYEICTDELKLDSVNNNIDQDVIELDIDAFIKTLCDNQFADKLAQSINEINIKKLGNTSLDDARNFSNFSNLSSIFNNTVSEVVSTANNNISEQNNQNVIPCSANKIDNNNNANVNNTANINASILESNLDNLDYDLIIKQNESTSNQQQFIENYSNNDEYLNPNKICIANEEISQLADLFSEPAFATLYGIMGPNNTSRDNSKDKIYMELDTNENDVNADEVINMDGFEQKQSEKVNNNNDKQKEKQELSIENKIDECEQDIRNVEVEKTKESTETDSKNSKKLKRHDSFIKFESENGDLSYSITKNKKSYIILAKSKNEIDRIEKEIKDSKITAQVSYPEGLSTSRSIEKKIEEAASVLLSSNLSNLDFAGESSKNISKKSNLDVKTNQGEDGISVLFQNEPVQLVTTSLQKEKTSQIEIDESRKFNSSNECSVIVTPVEISNNVCDSKVPSVIIKLTEEEKREQTKESVTEQSNSDILFNSIALKTIELLNNDTLNKNNKDEIENKKNNPSISNDPNDKPSFDDFNEDSNNFKMQSSNDISTKIVSKIFESEPNKIVLVENVASNKVETIIDEENKTLMPEQSNTNLSNSPVALKSCDLFSKTQNDTLIKNDKVAIKKETIKSPNLTFKSKLNKSKEILAVESSCDNMKQHPQINLFAEPKNNSIDQETEKGKNRENLFDMNSNIEKVFEVQQDPVLEHSILPEENRNLKDLCNISESKNTKTAITPPKDAVTTSNNSLGTFQETGKSSINSSENLLNLNCLASIATTIIMNESYSELTDELYATMNDTLKKSSDISLVKASSKSPRRSKKIKELLESNNNNLTENIESPKISNEKNEKNALRKPKSGSKRYFDDFAENLIDDEPDDLLKNVNKKSKLFEFGHTNEKNEEEKASDLPDIFFFAKKRQDEFKKKLKDKHN